MLPMQSLSEFQSFLKKARPLPAYFLFGPDGFVVEQAKTLLIAAIQAGCSTPLQPQTMDLDEMSIDNLVTSAQSLSMFVPLQVFVVKGIMKLRESQGKRLLAYLEKANPQTILIFTAGELDRDQRKKKIFEMLSGALRLVEFARLQDRELISWIERYLESRGFSIEQLAIKILLDLQGNDLGRISQELEKAMLYADVERHIDVAALEAISGFPASHTLSEFMQAIVRREERKALELIEEVFFMGKETGLAFWWFGQQLRQWLQFRELEGTGSAAVVGRQVGVYQTGAASVIASQAKQFSASSLMKAVDTLADVDDRMKRSSLDTRFAMEMLVHQLVHPS